MEQEGLLQGTCILFVQLGFSSRLQPWCVGYPVFLDPIDKDSKAENDDSWVATDLRAFGLHRVTLSIPGTRPLIFIMLPRLFTAEEGSAWCDSHCALPTEEELEAAEPNLLQGADPPG